MEHYPIRVYIHHDRFQRVGLEVMALFVTSKKPRSDLYGLLVSLWNIVQDEKTKDLVRHLIARALPL